MWIRNVLDCPIIKAGDGTALRELIHPHRLESFGVLIPYSLAHAMLGPGESSKPHRLIKSSEVYYILEGKGIMHVNDRESEVKPGHAVYIPKGALQWIENASNGNLVFLALVAPPWRKKDEEV